MKKIGNYRWRICGLLFAATTINYINRQTIGILAPELHNVFEWTEKDYGYIIMSFQIAYALGLLLSGRFLDKFGVKIGFTLAMGIWSLATGLHALCSTVIGFSAARFGLAIGQSANFPAAIKTVSEWFPKKERAFATGVFNAGSTIGAIIAPIVVLWLAIQWDWKWAFIITGSLGFLWLLLWLPFYRPPREIKDLSEGELEHIESDNEPEVKVSIPWVKLLTYKQTIGICLGRFLTDPIWWFFLYWLPKYLSSEHSIDLQALGLPLIIIYAVSSMGGIGGGWLSSQFIKSGRSIDFARKTSILIVALMVVPVFFLSYFSNLWIAVALISLATAAHQGWASNIFTVVSDIYPKKVVGSMTGLAGFAGAVGGVLFAPLVGFILDATQSYYIVFAIASCAYLLAWLSLKIFIPRIEPIVVSE